jgi:hypothetical protein
MCDLPPEHELKQDDYSGGLCDPRRSSVISLSLLDPRPLLKTFLSPLGVPRLSISSFRLLLDDLHDVVHIFVSTASGLGMGSRRRYALCQASISRDGEVHIVSDNNRLKLVDRHSG